MDWETKEVSLKHRITWEDQKIETVTLKMPGGRALRGIEKLVKSGGIAKDEDLGIDAMLSLIVILSDVPEGAEDELHITDITQLGEAMAPFLSGSLEQLGMSGSSSPSPDNGELTETPSPQT